MIGYLSAFGFIICLITMLSPSSFASSPGDVLAEVSPKDSTWNKIKETTSDVLDKGSKYTKQKVDDIAAEPSTRENRLTKPFHLAYTPIAPGLLYPIKSGFSGQYFFNEDWGTGLEYLSGGLSFSLSSVNFAEFKERLLLIPVYYYFGNNSFYLKSGLGQRKYTVKIGDALLDLAAKANSLEARSSMDLLEVSNEVAIFGIGNQWQLPIGFTFGFDWIEVFIPLGSGEVHENISKNLTGTDKTNFERTVDFMENKPTLNIFKLNIAWAF